MGKVIPVIGELAKPVMAQTIYRGADVELHREEIKDGANLCVHLRERTLVNLKGMAALGDGHIGRDFLVKLHHLGAELAID